MNIVDQTQLIRNLAREEGFDFCGIARAEQLDDDARRLENWLLKGMHGSMKYMENFFDLRVNPRKLVAGAKSVITFLLNYYPEQERPPHLPKISKYAYGTDYHEVIRKKLNHILQQIRERIGEIQGRGFVDSAPVLERSWAERSGLGWIGKNANLINNKMGSFLFIATLIVDLELKYDEPFAKDFCGTCRKCVDACPTEAILDNKVVDGSRCISYLTIELKDALIPQSMSGKFDNWIFGCDICQDICPWNRFSKANHEAEFKPLPEIMNLSNGDWEAMTEEGFKKIFKDSAVKRAKYSGLRRNLRFIQT
ncbi:MAG: tRNA epoxyqueuosine(34) reductase QueG [Chitinophagales bacterium]